MPKKQTKRSLVVNGREEGFMLRYFNNYVTNLINGIKLRQEAVASAQQAYDALRDRQTREFLNNVNTQQSKSSNSIQKQAKALHTAQTDKTFVPAVGRRQNPELDAIPVKEDNTGPLGYAAAIAPFAVAAAPFAAATPTAFANPYVQAGINSYFAAEGVDDIINGRANWSTPINFLPFYGGATKTLANAVGKAYNSGKKAYDTTRLAMGLNNDIRKFTPKYTLKGGNVRTRIGDVEINDPNLFYHLDFGDRAGAFGKRGSYIVNGKLHPGIGNDGAVPYTWWNKGKPYATSIGDKQLTRMITTTFDDNPSLLHVRSQNYPIGQWNPASSGKKGFILNSEYVSSEPIKVGGHYIWKPGYGYAKVKNDGNAISWNTAKDNITKQDFRNRLNEFTEKYGYEKAPKEATYDELKDYAKKVIDQHNSFYRGVYLPNTPEDIEAISKLGLTNSDDILRYVATHPRESGPKGLWITPHNNGSIYGGIGKEGKVAVVRRPYTLGEDPMQWFNEGDFTLTRGGNPIEAEAVVDPWLTPDNLIGAPTSIPNELVSTSPMEFVRFVDEKAMPTLSHIRHFPTQEELIRYNYLNNRHSHSLGGQLRRRSLKSVKHMF